MTTRIAILGGPRCGKTTLMQQLYVDMKVKGLDVGCEPEYSTLYLKEKGMIESISEQYGIYLGQSMLEESLSVHDYAVTDYATFIPYVYGRFMLGSKERSKKEIEILKDLYKLALRDISKYDYIFYVGREFGYEQDGIRWQNEQLAIAIDEAIKQFLDAEHIKYIELNGDTKERANTAMEIMSL
ncbi:AAA domain-containing protein [Clostridium collagenovorans DSM 3089]|uniref:AAA domain-containing protein n=1 Tax=Clostridium collagenovorans DSM 3089 TaxID=1121306 RepID=A0A1M5XWB2_9CLOT|nr:ATP-binding protein [Clostridium collagenovorans]SHI04125.1 AAA domain-containing protein [Clostridium collagenovorans DSM 3089]